MRHEALVILMKYVSISNRRAARVSIAGAVARAGMLIILRERR